ncbi:Oxidation resistance protein 1 [Schistosoma japonicum]|nr:Oxidation resistance protein 1 [Schistosoma japonicum]
MSFRKKANLNSAQAFLYRSRSLYDGTKSTMRLSNITSKLRTVSETLANTNPFSSKSQDTNIAEENPAKQPEGIKKVKRRSCKRTTSRTESSTSTGGHASKHEKKKRKNRQKHNDSEASTLAKTSNVQQTLEYVVQEGDSFNSVAARFDITPSELCRVNKFLTRTLFVGQVIKLPIHEDASNITDELSNKPIFSNEQIDSNKANPLDSSQMTTETAPDNILDPELSVSKEDSKSKLSQSDDSLTSSANETDTDEQDLDDSSAYSEYTDYADEENDPMACQYLKFDCNFVVDLHCSVPGMILVTTNMFVFKPFDEKQYPLENHCKQIPLNQLRTIAVYRDPSVMYFTKRGEQPSTSSTNVNIDNDANDSLNSTLQMPSVIVTKHDDTSTKEGTSQINLNEKNSYEIEQKNVEDTVTPDTQQSPLVSNVKKCDLVDNPYYLCILASTNSLENKKYKRHPHWFTIQSEEYWFLIPNDKAKTLFDFLLTCRFHGSEDNIEPSTDMEVSQLSVKSTGTKDMNVTNTVSSKFHSKSLGNLSFFKSPITSPVSNEPLYMEDGGSDTVSKSEKPSLRHHIHKHTHRRHDQYHFVVVPNTFDWILPRIGSPDNHSQALLILKNYQLERAQSSKEGISHYQDEHSQLSELKESQSMQQSTDSPSIKHTTDSLKSVDKYNSIPSMEEEKAALQLLKRETVDWELVSSKELELKELEEEKRKQFMFDCIKLAEPELLPIPTATSNSEIFDVHKVRDLLQNLNPDAEGLDWILTYSTSIHGFSLRSLYRQCSNCSTEPSKDNLHNLMHARMKHTHTSNPPHASNQPCILIIRTSINEIFGAMLNTHPYPSSGRFYGNGSCFVFRWINSNGLEQNQLKETNSTAEHDPTSPSPNSNKLMNIPNVNSVISPSTLNDLSCDISLADCENVTKEFANLFYSDEKELPEQSNKQTFQKFVWSGKNSYFINGGYDLLTIGCSQGHSAIQLDDVLLHGHSDNCETFDSPQLSSSPDFVITTLEIWSFI